MWSVTAILLNSICLKTSCSARISPSREDLGANLWKKTLLFFFATLSVRKSASGQYKLLSDIQSYSIRTIMKIKICNNMLSMLNKVFIRIQVPVAENKYSIEQCSSVSVLKNDQTEEMSIICPKGWLNNESAKGLTRRRVSKSSTSRKIGWEHKREFCGVKNGCNGRCFIQPWVRRWRCDDTSVWRYTVIQKMANSTITVNDYTS